MNESEMGYRGSKSELEIGSVKEQRVDGSCFGISPKLRYTLMGGESRYQIKIPSKQLKNKRNFCMAQVHLTKLDPWFITGFCDG